MKLRALDYVKEDLKVLMCYTTEDRTMSFVEDKLIENLGCTRGYVKEIKSLKGLKNADADARVYPIDSDCWLFKINCDKRENLFNPIIKNLENNVSGVYLLYTTKYYIYKRFIDDKKMQSYGIQGLYLDRLDKEDIIYLYDNVVKNNTLSKQLTSYVVENYGSDVDSLWKLFTALNTGAEFKTKKDIVQVCGTGGNTIQKLLLGILKSKTKKDMAGKPTDERGLESYNKGIKVIIRNKTKSFNELLGAYNIRYIQKGMISLVSALCDLKVLYISGDLYKKELNKEVLKGYDEKNINRGMKYWYTIHELSLKELLYLRYNLEYSVWQDIADFELFLYKYYN